MKTRRPRYSGGRGRKPPSQLHSDGAPLERRERGKSGGNDNTHRVPMGILMGVARKLNPTGRAHHSAGRKAEDVSAPEGEHTTRSSGGAGGATPRKPRWTSSVRWYAELAAVADK